MKCFIARVRFGDDASRQFFSTSDRFEYDFWISSNNVLEPELDQRLDYAYLFNQPFDGATTNASEWTEITTKNTKLNLHKLTSVGTRISNDFQFVLPTKTKGAAKITQTIRSVTLDCSNWKRCVCVCVCVCDST